MGEPVVVLTYAYSGVAQLRKLLDGHPGLACLSGVGLAQMCEQILNSWEHLETPAARLAKGIPSRLAVNTTRSMINTMVGVDLVRAGKTRWCDTTPGAASAVESFLRCYPEATFVSLHRHCASLISAALRASPWGLNNPGFAPFVTTHPANSVAALAAFWIVHTQAILTEEAAHPDRCFRMRYEDLTARPAETAREVYSFLGLDDIGCLGANPASADGGDTDIPAGMISPGMLDLINDLLSELGYRPIRRGE
jgi:protein-tyrosine sulfotransferase